MFNVAFFIFREERPFDPMESVNFCLLSSERSLKLEPLLGTIIFFFLSFNLPTSSFCIPDLLVEPWANEGTSLFLALESDPLFCPMMFFFFVENGFFTISLLLLILARILTLLFLSPVLMNPGLCLKNNFKNFNT